MPTHTQKSSGDAVSTSAMTISHHGRAALAALALLGATLASPAAAQQPLVREIKLGALVHDVPGLWSGFRLEQGYGVNAEVVLSPSVPFLGGDIRPAIGGTWSTSGDTSKGYFDLRWEIESRSGLFLGLGIGAAVHNGLVDPTDPNRKALGARVLFHFPLEVGIRLDRHNSLSIYFDHISNGYTASPNEGLDTLGVRYGYRF